MKQSTPPADVKFVAISSGGRHNCGIEKDTQLAKCWGDNNNGQATPPADVKFVAISGGGFHTCGIEKDTEVTKCWGSNDNGQSTPPLLWGTHASLAITGTSSACAVGRESTLALGLKVWGDRSYKITSITDPLSKEAGNWTFHELSCHKDGWGDSSFSFTANSKVPFEVVLCSEIPSSSGNRSCGYFTTLPSDGWDDIGDAGYDIGTDSMYPPIVAHAKYEMLETDDHT